VVAHAQSEPSLNKAVEEAQAQLQQTFTNLQFEDFGPSPVKGPIYQASAGGRIVYYAPDSEHILFAAVYDRNGLNVTALAQDAAARRKLAGIDTSKALALGPVDAPTVIEFTDPDCPYCRALTASGREGSRRKTCPPADLLRQRHPPGSCRQGRAYIARPTRSRPSRRSTPALGLPTCANARPVQPGSRPMPRWSARSGSAARRPSSPTAS
jgi:hypothetical protein